MNKTRLGMLAGIIGVAAIISITLVATGSSSSSEVQNGNNVSGSIFIDDSRLATFNNSDSFVAEGTIHSTVAIVINNTLQKSSLMGAAERPLLSSYPNVTSTSSNSTIDTNNDLAAAIGSSTKALLWGNWHLDVNHGKLRSFNANISTAYDDAMNFHTHQFSNFKPSANAPAIKLNTNGTTVIPGTMDIGVNGEVAWQDVKTEIIIADGKILTIVFDNNAIDQHFSGQPVYGIVARIDSPM